jgi:hypothetical protein
MSKFSEPPEIGTDCTDIYVIVRVSRIGKPQPSYKLIANLHRALFDGNLQYAHDMYLKCSTEVQV